jgi:hypothetical protein
MSMAAHADLGPPDVEYMFQHEQSAPRGARRALSAITGSGSLANDVKLAASELVTNVVRHTDKGGWIHAWGGDPLRLEVHDTSSVLPARVGRPTNSGRGLRIVDAVSSDWGTTTTPEGKMVWAEFDRPR